MQYTGIIIGVVILVLVVLFMIFARRGNRMGGVVQMAHLKCPKCNSEFDYEYVPGASFTSIRLGESRFLRCPVCHKWSMFNVWKTRVDPETHKSLGHLKVGPS